MAGTRVRLPRGIRKPFEVYVNGVPQVEGTDYVVEGATLRFDRELVHEGKLGFWRWAIGAIGIGTYRPDHSVDVRYEAPDGRPMVAERLPLEPVQ
jgi:hypothetical protein